MNLIVVILNGTYLEDGTPTRENDCIKLFSYGFENYTSTKLIEGGDVARTIDVVNATSESKTLDLVCTNTLDCIVETDEVIDATPVINLNNVLAPISKGEVVGTITYTIDDIKYSSDLIASHDVYTSSVMNSILLLGIIFIILLLLVILTSKPKRKK